MYKKARKINTIDSYEQFLREYPAGFFSDEAKKNIEKIEFQRAKKLNNIDAYEQFIKKYPNNHYYAIAKIYRDFLKRMDSQYFTVVLLPDTQYYSKGDEKIYYAQTSWIADHSEKFNIKFVIHLGDITHDNTDRQWEVADKAHRVLDNAGIPYSMIPGNHDVPEHASIRNTDKYNQYFGPDRFEEEDWYGGHKGKENDNNYTFFEEGDLKFMVVSLEYAPTKDSLRWASGLIDLYRDRRVIIATHCYQDKLAAGEKCGGEHQKNCSNSSQIDGSGGDTVWNELIRKHSNIFLVLSGHITDVEHKVRLGLNGNKVQEILTDFQKEKRGGYNNGNGWLRVLQFLPGENKIYVMPFTVNDDVTEFNQIDVYDKNPMHSDHTYAFCYDMGSHVDCKDNLCEPATELDSNN